MKKLASLSVVIPCFNEEEVLPITMKELVPLLKSWERKIISSYQVVFANNGSTDNTLEVMISLKKKYKCVKIIDLRNNFGYQSSISAGLFHADNDLTISIDSDLQDDPRKMEEMIHWYYKGYDMVLGIRDSRKTDGFFKRIFSKGFYKIMQVLGANSVYNHGDFRLLAKPLVNALKEYPEKNRYLRGLVLSIESRYAKVYYDRRKRLHGETKFKPFQLISLALDGITSFTIKPIRWIFLMGLSMFLVAFFLIVYVLYLSTIEGIPIQGWASTLIIILFFGGVQNIALGIVGEYIAKTYTETKQRPLYIVRKIYN